MTEHDYHRLAPQARGLSAASAGSAELVFIRVHLALAMGDDVIFKRLFAAKCLPWHGEDLPTEPNHRDIVGSDRSISISVVRPSL
jgi:hypothetical protein